MDGGPSPMHNDGFYLSLRSVGDQLAAMPAACYLVRLIHFQTRRPFPGERLWTTCQLLNEATIRFLRARNREGFDIYFRPYAGNQNAGYILVDLDDSPPAVLSAMRTNGHEPCVVIETSPGHWQAWIRVSDGPLAPFLATQIAHDVAELYHGDRASADWCRIGRLAGFTNRKPQRQLPTGWPPWVRLRTARLALASNAAALIAAALRPATKSHALQNIRCSIASAAHIVCAGDVDVAAALAIYQSWLTGLQIPQRFSSPDWSIADLWIAKALLARGMPGVTVKSILRLASPGFPRSHFDPEDYLRRTLARALRDGSNFSCFPARPGANSVD